MNTIHYLETSAVNVLADQIADFSFVEALQKGMRIDFCISGIVIWEVLLNSSNSRKEQLLHWLQFNCADYLLKSPTELIVSYIRAGLPMKDKRGFWYDRKSVSELAQTWKRIHKKADRTIPVELSKLQERTAPIRQLAKMHRGLVDAMTDKTQDGYEDDPFHRMMVRLRRDLGFKGDPLRRDEKRFKTTLILTLFMLCIGIELDNSPVRDFWQSTGLQATQPFERLEYLIETHSSLFVRGPLVEMMLMVEAQGHDVNMSNRGMFLDCLHTIYCYYADNVISADRHFLALKERNHGWMFDGIISAETYVALLNDSREMLIAAARPKD